MEKGKIIRIIALITAIIVVIGSIFIIKGCSSPPKYEEIKDRFELLVSNSKAVNVILFGEGLPTYERIYHPKDSLEVYTEKYTDAEGQEQERKVWYYRTLDEKYEIYGFRSSYLSEYSYALVSDNAKSADELKALFPITEATKAPEGKEFYSQIFAKDNKISYLIPYVEQIEEFYYSSLDSDDYDVVRGDSPISSVDQIKELAQSVYSRNYCNSLYSVLFDGVAAGSEVLLARYVESQNAGGSGLTQWNGYEPLFSEHRVYLFDTARIEKWGSNSKYVRIMVQTYLPSTPNDIVEIEIELSLQDGEWYLEGPTF